MLQELETNPPANAQNMTSLVIPSITDLVMVAIQLKDYEYLQELFAHHQKTTYSAEQLFQNQHNFNKLLRDNAQVLNNRAALALIKFGANINHRGKLITKNEKPVECYFLDMLVHWNNFSLFEAIGAEKFDLSIYQINKHRQHNIHNPKINYSHYDPNCPNITRKEMRQKRALFEQDKLKRLLCCSMFCYWIIKHNRLDLLERLKQEYNSTTPATSNWRIQKYLYACKRSISTELTYSAHNTSSIIAIYAAAKNKTIHSRYWFDKQNKVDRMINLPLATYGVKFYLSNILQFDFIRLLPQYDIHAQEVQNVLINHYWQHYGWRTIIFMLCIPGIAGLTLGILNLLADNQPAETYILVITSALTLLFMAFELLRVLAAFVLRAISKQHIEIFGGANTIALRYYTNTMAAELVEATNGFGETAESVLNNSREYTTFFGFAFPKKERLPNKNQVDKDFEIEMQELHNTAYLKMNSASV